MALITYTGGAESNSLITVDWMESYLADIVPGGALRDSWTALSTKQKEYRLELTAMLMGWLPLRGSKSYRNQRLPFPRDCQLTPAAVPDEAKKAQALICYELVSPEVDKAFAASPPDSAGNQQVVSFSFGALSGELSETATLGTSSVVALIKSSCFQAYMMLAPYLMQIRGKSIKTTSELLLDAQSLLTTTTS